jgi:hypothetical protein
VLANNTVYVAFASYGDRTPYHGWVFRFDVNTLAQHAGAFITTPGAPDGEGGIWMSGEGLAVDGAGNLYFTTGNGSFDGRTDFGDCFVKLTPDLRVASWFAPFNNADLNKADMDLGSGGVLLIPGTDLVLGGGKEGKFYLLDQRNLGGFHPGNDNQIPQSFYVNRNHHIHGTPTVWRGPMGTWVYVWPEVDFLRAYAFSGNRFPANGAGQVVPAKMGTTGETPGMPGGFLTLSANGATAGTGIVWANHPWAEDLNQKIGEGVLRAYDASTLEEKWNSRTDRARDDFGNFSKFCPPTVTNGKVYLPTMGGLHRKVTIWTDTAREGPTLANLNDNLLVLGWTGTDDPGHLNVRWTNDGINWNGKATDWNNASDHALALASGLGRLFMAWTGTDERLNVHGSTDLVHWLNKSTLNETSNHGPALSFGNGRLFMAWTGTDGHLNVISSADGVQWSNKVTLGDTSPTAPGLAFFNNTLFLLWCGTDGNRSLNVMQSVDGTHWGNKVTFGESSDSAPAMALERLDGAVPFLCWCEFQNRMYVAWTGTETHLNVAVLSLGGVSAYGLA